MPAAKVSKDAPAIDGLMEKASDLLVARDYFAAEQNCVAALSLALASEDFERAARILMPLQESRRQKRDMAFDTRHVERVGSVVPSGESLRPGCYLVEPPRVGIEGRTLREEADRRGIPIIVIVREPTTRGGMWPIVAIGPHTVRTRVPPPEPGRPRKGRRGRSAEPASPDTPDPEWFLKAGEALGDTAIAQAAEEPSVFTRVQMLADRLQAVPDHEKLHQALEAACREAARIRLQPPRKRPAAAPVQPDDQ